MIVGKRALWLVEDCVISCYHPARGCNTEALIFKMAAARFLDVFEEETNKMKENAVALIISRVIIPNCYSPQSGSVNIFRQYSLRLRRIIVK